MMKKIAAVVVVLAIVALMGVGYLAYSFLRTPEAATGPIEAIPIAIADSQTAVGEIISAEDVESPVAETATAAPVETDPQTTATTTGSDNSQAVMVATEEEQATNEIGAETSAAPIIFEIVQAESQARFLIDEVLRGDPITVVGVTDQIAGQFAIDPNNLPNTQLGVIRVNARTLATDNDFRNRAIKNQILLTDAHEFITFAPSQIIGLPHKGTVGEVYTFQIVGDLTITGVTRPVTFDVIARSASETSIRAVASTTILYADFGVSIPRVPSVDLVADEVRLELEFVAEAI